MEETILNVLSVLSYIVTIMTSIAVFIKPRLKQILGASFKYINYKIPILGLHRVTYHLNEIVSPLLYIIAICMLIIEILFYAQFTEWLKIIAFIMLVIIIFSTLLFYAFFYVRIKAIKLLIVKNRMSYIFIKYIILMLLIINTLMASIILIFAAITGEKCPYVSLYVLYLFTLILPQIIWLSIDGYYIKHRLYINLLCDMNVRIEFIDNSFDEYKLDDIELNLLADGDISIFNKFKGVQRYRCIDIKHIKIVDQYFYFKNKKWVKVTI